jgi:hypothetical protein
MNAYGALYLSGAGIAFNASVNRLRTSEKACERSEVLDAGSVERTIGLRPKYRRSGEVDIDAP